MEEVQEPKKKSTWWRWLIVPLIGVVGFVVWLNSSKEACPPGAHPVMLFAASHNLHYRMVEVVSGKCIQSKMAKVLTEGLSVSIQPLPRI